MTMIRRRRINPTTIPTTPIFFCWSSWSSKRQQVNTESGTEAGFSKMSLSLEVKFAPRGEVCP
jgi:hypothetical protein